MPPSEAAPETQVECLMVTLENPADAAKASAVIRKVEGVQKVDCDEKGCFVTAKAGCAKAVADALKAAGIQASVWVKQA